MADTSAPEISSATAPALRARKIEHWPIDRLVPLDGNAKQHPDDQVEAVAQSIRNFGFVDPILVLPSGEIVAGHCTRLASQRLGMTKVPVVVLDGLSLPHARALSVALNKLPELGEWDEVALQRIVAEAAQLELPPISYGFSQREILELLEGPTSAAEPTPEPEPIAVSRAGDIWQLGEHRILCGDCTKADDVARVLKGARPGLCVTDPPYGINYDPTWRNDAAAAGLLNFSPRRVGLVANDHRADWREAWELFPGDVIYSWHPSGAPSMVHGAALQAAGFEIRMQIIWAKSNFPIGRGDYHVRHEPCWYAVRKGKRSNRTDDRTQNTLWEINLDRNVEGGHSTQKPVECMARPIRNHEPTDVYEPFSGSGTTIVACEQLGRRCFAIELQPNYVDVAVRRWQRLTGEAAMLEDGRSFDEVQRERTGAKSKRPDKRPAGKKRARRG